MPTQEEIEGSPYHDKQARPTGSATSRASQATDQSKDAKTKHRAKSAPVARSKKGKAHGSQGERQRVSRTLTQQLENYINIEKREQQFSTNGIVTTTHRMEPYDVAYRLIEAHQLERDSPRNPKSKYRGVRGVPQIDPQVTDNSRRVMQYAEVDRMVQNANAIYHSLPISKLTTIHRYRPHPREEGGSARTGKVQGYHRHFGAALHAHKYVDFYTKTELDNGNPSSSRLQKLPKRRSGSIDESFNSSTSRRSSTHRDRQDRRNGNQPKSPPKSDRSKEQRDNIRNDTKIDRRPQQERYPFIKAVLAESDSNRRGKRKSPGSSRRVKRKARNSDEQRDKSATSSSESTRTSTTSLSGTSHTHKQDDTSETSKNLLSPRTSEFPWRNHSKGDVGLSGTDDRSESHMNQSGRNGILPPLSGAEDSNVEQGRKEDSTSQARSRREKKRSKKRKHEKYHRDETDPDYASVTSISTTTSKTSISTTSFEDDSKSVISEVSLRPSLRSRCNSSTSQDDLDTNSESEVAIIAGNRNAQKEVTNTTGNQKADKGQEHKTDGASVSSKQSTSAHSSGRKSDTKSTLSENSKASLNVKSKSGSPHGSRSRLSTSSRSSRSTRFSRSSGSTRVSRSSYSSSRSSVASLSSCDNQRQPGADPSHQGYGDKTGEAAHEKCLVQDEGHGNMKSKKKVEELCGNEPIVLDGEKVQKLEQLESRYTDGQSHPSKSNNSDSDSYDSDSTSCDSQTSRDSSKSSESDSGKIYTDQRRASYCSEDFFSD